LEWYGHCRRQCIEVCSADQNCTKCRKFFHLYFSVVRMGPRSTFVLHWHCFVVSVTVSLSTWKGHVSWLKGLIWYITSWQQQFQTGIRNSLHGACVSWDRDAKKVVRPKPDWLDSAMSVAACASNRHRTTTVHNRAQDCATVVYNQARDCTTIVEIGMQFLDSENAQYNLANSSKIYMHACVCMYIVVYMCVCVCVHVCACMHV